MTLDDLDKALHSFIHPVLIVSTVAGKGNYTIGEALEERILPSGEVYHIPIEEMLPPKALEEDYKRYALISNHAPFLLNLIYRWPIFYYRKFLRERYLKITNMEKIKEVLDTFKIKTVICVSHRPAFWLSNLKFQKRLDISLWGVLTEFGRNLGWKYISWEAMDGYLSPVGRNVFDFPFPEGLRCLRIKLPCKSGYYALAYREGSRDNVLMAAGHWGQISARKARGILEALLERFPMINVSVVCGKNDNLFNVLSAYFKNTTRVTVYAEVDNLLKLMEKCGSIVTKPGASTIVEAHASGRKIFLIKGMPVAEDNNALYAIKHFGAQWFNMENFENWHGSR